MHKRFFSDTAAQKVSIERMVGTMGLRLEWLPPGDDQPRTDMVNKVIYIPSPLPTWGPHEYKMLRAFIYHEVGHHHASQSALTDMMDKEGLSMGGKFGCVLNALDDVWQEMITSRNYLGAADDLSYCQAHFCRKATEAVQSGANVDDHALKVLGLCYKARSDWQDLVGLAFNGYESHTDLSNLDHLCPRINGIIDHSNPAYELLEIAKAIFDDDPEQEQSGQEAMQENQQQKEQGEDKSEDEGKGEGEGGKSDDSDEGEDGQGGLVSYKDLMAHNHEKEQQGGVAEGLQIIYDHEPAYDYQPYDIKQIITGVPDESIGYACSAESITRTYNSQKHVAQNLRRLFQSTSQRKREYQRQRGKLTAKHLPRVMQGDDRLFNTSKTRVDDTADIYILVDKSGSMVGERYRNATTAAIVLSEALAAANVQHKVATFTSLSYDHNMHHTIRDWNERPSVDVMADRFSVGVMAGNADGDDILLASRELMKRKNKRKLIIVLSDGQPASMRDGDCYTYTEEVIKNCSRLGIECYGIGIQTNSVKGLYPESKVINSADEILPALSEVVQSKIIGG